MRSLMFAAWAVLLCGCAAPSTEQIVKQSHEAVVEVVVLLNGEKVAGGSGAFIDNQGTVLTAAHVVPHSGAFHVITADGVQHEAYVIYRDDKADVAFIRLVDGRRGKACLQINPVNPPAGALVLFIGSPLLAGETATLGLAAYAEATGFNGMQEPALRVSSMVVPGNSGGPLVYVEDGTLVGIASHVRIEMGSFTGVSYAVPGSVAFKAYEKQLGHPPVCN